ncbi:MAG: response regulator transcription factor [Planctomycetota bacterium]|jgi:DNA-binding NarL/FixJ family response regulator|nr:DNA-binding response regulator [Planctomycetota bacterium]MDP6519743.1 response regulator transcription factor [Planctomycetota bacterium]MDP6837325.1 response regulator transcription factor [Planctomycetota bacterium]MDP6954459.1 response regulator transcription factor [Planctomycetota bacterium]
MTSTSQPIRIFLIDDQALVRAAFRSFLCQNDRFEVVGDAGDARGGIEEVEKLRPDIVTLDITMPGLSGIDAIPRLRKVHPRVKILMLSHHEGDSLVEQALREGAEGYLSKDSDPAELSLAIEAVYRGDPFLSPRVARGLVARTRRGTEDGDGVTSRIHLLTPREREVFQLLALGRSNKEVATELGMSLGTAKKHRENLQRKLDCHSAAELARLAIREGLLES